MTFPNVQITIDKTFHTAFFLLDNSKQGNYRHRDGQGQAGKNNELLMMCFLEMHHQLHAIRTVAPELEERPTF